MNYRKRAAVGTVFLEFIFTQFEIVTIIIKGRLHSIISLSVQLYEGSVDNNHYHL